MHLGRFSRLPTVDSIRLSRRATLHAAGATLVAAIAARSSWSPAVRAAQDGTPSPQAENPDLTTELLGVGVPSPDPDQAIQLIRVTLAPGGTTEPHRRPGARVSWVEAGAWEVTIIEGRAELQPAGGDRLTDRQPLASGDVHLLEAGDSLFIDEGTVLASRSAGTEPLVVFHASLSPAGDLSTISIPVGTPAATPAE